MATLFYQSRSPGGGGETSSNKVMDLLIGTNFQKGEGTPFALNAKRKGLI